MKFSATEVKALRKPGRHTDGDGLHLFISKTGGKSWVQRMTIDGRRRDIGLGGYPSVSLAQARKRASDNREADWQWERPSCGEAQAGDAHFPRGLICCARSQQASLAQRKPHAGVDSDPRTTCLPQDRQQACRHHKPQRPAGGPYTHMVDAPRDRPASQAEDANDIQVGHGQRARSRATRQGKP